MKAEEAVERLHAQYCLTSGCEQYPSDPTCGLRKALNEFAAAVREKEHEALRPWLREAGCEELLDIRKGKP